jgi:hydroxyethylthiazole kinase-like uncharacterized protein yjeF
MEVAAHITAVMLARVQDGVALSTLLEDQRITAICLGPGLGLGDEKKDLIQIALASGRPCVLDADACTLIALSAELFSALHSKCVLTPHWGEFRRLFPEFAGSELEQSYVTLQAAERAGCCVLLKGAETSIAMPDGDCLINSATGARAVPWLATAGAGDVLAGFITGLLARGMDTRNAAALATWLHVECALRFGPGLIAEDIADELPAVLRGLRLRAAQS